MLNALYQNKVRFYDEDQFYGFLQNDSSLLEEIQNQSVYQTHKGPFFVSNIGEILERVHLWKKYLPNVGMFFQISANPDPVLIKILYSYGMKFSCSTGPEIEELISKDILSSSIIYSGLCKLSRHIRTAQSNNVNSICFGTLAELKRIVTIHNNAQLFLRFNLDTSNVDFSYVNLSANSLDEIDSILTYAAQFNANIYGLHFDLPQNCNSETYKNTFDILKSIITMAKTDYNINIKSINIGSGVPMFDMQNDSLFSNFVLETDNFAVDFPMIELIAEPGEFIVKNSVHLCCSVVGLRQVYNNDGERTMFYYLNDGLYGSLSNIIFHQYKPELFVIKQSCFDRQENLPSTKASFWGPTCDSMDKICTIDDVPSLNIGDLVFFKNVGLYSRSCASNFNGFEIPQSFHVISYQRLESMGIDRQTAEVFSHNFTKTVMA